MFNVTILDFIQLVIFMHSLSNKVTTFTNTFFDFKVVSANIS